MKEFVDTNRVLAGAGKRVVDRGVGEGAMEKGNEEGVHVMIHEWIMYITCASCCICMRMHALEGNLEMIQVHLIERN